MYVHAVNQTLEFLLPVPTWVNSSHSYILIGTCLLIKKIYDRVVKATALCIFNSVNDCYPKSMFKKRKKSIRTTFTPKVNIFCYFAYVFKLLLLQIYQCLSHYQKNLL